MSSDKNSANNSDNINIDNALDNLYRYIDNLKQNPNHNKQKVEEYGRNILYLINKYPFMIKAWSDDPRGVEYVKQEALRRIAAIKAKGTT